MERCLDSLRRAGMIEFVPPALLTRSVIRFLSGLRTGTQSSQADLDEAWDISIRGSMKLHMADIHLHRARLFYRETRYPWKSPRVDLDAAATIIHECGYHRHNEELSDARSMILRAC